jgi:large subunit ribosomal protein L22
MEVRATAKYVRISPLKARDVTRVIQGMPVSQALNILNFTPRKAAHLVGKTLKSAIANAEHNHDISAENLFIKTAVALTGPAFGRIKPMARGSANPIRKPTTHIQIILSDGQEAAGAAKAAKKTKATKAEAAAEEKPQKKPAAQRKPSARKSAKEASGEE